MPTLSTTNGPTLPPACATEKDLLEQDLGLQLAYSFNAFDFVISYDSECDCNTVTYGDNLMLSVESACNDANGIFSSTPALTAECGQDPTTYYTNYPWCIGQSCTFDEYFDLWVASQEEDDDDGDVCTYTQGMMSEDSAGVLVMSSSYQFMIVSSIIMAFLHK